MTTSLERHPNSFNIALNLGGGLSRGPFGLDVFTGIGEVPDLSKRLKYVFK